LWFPGTEIEDAETAEGEDGSFTGTGLTLDDDVATLGDGYDSPGLDGGGFIEPVAKYTPNQVILQTHSVESWEHLDFLTGFELKVAILL